MKPSTIFQTALYALVAATAIADPRFFFENVLGWAVIFTSGPAVSQMSGSIGGTTFSRNKGGAYMRSRAIPTNPSSVAQLRTRAILQTLSASFQDLTEGQRQAWQNWARQNPVNNALGESILLSGHQSYNKINSKIVLAGSAAIATPPIVNSPDAFTSISQSGDIGAGDTALTFAPVLTAGNQVELWAAVVNSAAINNVNSDYRFISFSAVDEVTPWDNQLDIEAVLGALLVGQTLHVKAAQFDVASGQSSEFLTSRVLISTT